jgi:tetratricopeptide (TPR) repeat protein
MRLFDRALEALHQSAAPSNEIGRCQLGRAEDLYCLGEYDQSLLVRDDLYQDPSLQSGNSLLEEGDRLQGLVLFEMERYEEARASLVQALEVFKDLKMRDWKVDVRNFISDVYLALGHPDEAWESAMLAYDAYHRFSEPIGCAETAYTLGDISAARREYIEAEHWYLRSIEQAEESTDPRAKLDSLIHFVRFFIGQAKYDKALEHLQRVFNIPDRMEERAVLRQIKTLRSQALAGKIALRR